jgi:hypothetical protein
MSLKLVAYGILEYCKDLMNVFDAIVVILSLVEILLLSKSAISTFR